jgi:hypothetical protein
MTGNIAFVRAPDKVAVGVKEGYWRKTVILLDDETHADVVSGAQSNHCSFAAQARMLIEVGLEALKTEPGRAG